MQLSKRAPDAPVDDLIKLCDHAISRTASGCELAYFAARTLKSGIGRIESAIVDFKNAYELNPKNLDAAREVRLYEMRRAKMSEQRRTTPSARRSRTPPTGQRSSPPPRNFAPAQEAVRRATRRKKGASCPESVNSSSVDVLRLPVRLRQLARSPVPRGRRAQARAGSFRHRRGGLRRRGQRCSCLTGAR